MERARREWTREEDGTLIAMLSDRAPLIRIAGRLNRTMSAVTRRRHLLLRQRGDEATRG